MDALGAFVVGALAQSSLIISGIAVYFFILPDRVVGQMAGFGAGALLGAAMFELIPEAEMLSNWEIAIWMLVGGAVYVVADWLIERRSGKSSGAMGVGGRGTRHDARLRLSTTLSLDAQRLSVLKGSLRGG